MANRPPLEIHLIRSWRPLQTNTPRVIFVQSKVLQYSHNDPLLDKFRPGAVCQDIVYMKNRGSWSWTNITSELDSLMLSLARKGSGIVPNSVNQHFRTRVLISTPQHWDLSGSGQSKESLFPPVQVEATVFLNENGDENYKQLANWTISLPVKNPEKNPTGSELNDFFYPILVSMIDKKVAETKNKVELEFGMERLAMSPGVPPPGSFVLQFFRHFLKIDGSLDDSPQDAIRACHLDLLRVLLGNGTEYTAVESERDRVLSEPEAQQLLQAYYDRLKVKYDPKRGLFSMLWKKSPTEWKEKCKGNFEDFTNGYYQVTIPENGKPTLERTHKKSASSNVPAHTFLALKLIDLLGIHKFIFCRDVLETAFREHDRSRAQFVWNKYSFEVHDDRFTCEKIERTTVGAVTPVSEEVEWKIPGVRRSLLFIGKEHLVFLCQRPEGPVLEIFTLDESLHGRIFGSLRKQHPIQAFGQKFSMTGGISDGLLFMHHTWMQNAARHSCLLLRIADCKQTAFEFPTLEGVQIDKFELVRIKHLKQTRKVFGLVSCSTKWMNFVVWDLDPNTLEATASSQFPTLVLSSCVESEKILQADFRMIRKSVFCLVEFGLKNLALYQVTERKCILIKVMKLSRGKYFILQMHLKEPTLFAYKLLSSRCGQPNVYQIYRLQLKF